MVSNAMTVPVQEAARILGIGRLSMYRLIKDGQIPVIRVGHRPILRISKTALEEFVRDESRKAEVN